MMATIPISLIIRHTPTPLPETVLESSNTVGIELPTTGARREMRGGAGEKMLESGCVWYGVGGGIRMGRSAR